MADIVMGTAGHIDHGKTTLVRSLTGIDTDRLKEEKARGITIELGFAHLTLPSGRRVAFVDVPGHEKFIKNMLAGATGIDLGLLVIAADEGVMPQTREHLDILRLLETKELVVVLTKVDLVDEEFIFLAEEEVRELLTSTPYAQAPIVKVSAHTGQGLASLVKLLDDISGGVKPRQSEGIACLPIDRVFSVRGFGTVVTGTLASGQIKLGDNLELPLRSRQVRLRQLQVHNESVTQARAGQRVAVNLAGVEAQELERGEVLCEPGWLVPTKRLDASCIVLKNSPWPLENMLRVRFYQGTKETLGRIFILDKEALLPGEEGFIQLVLEEPVTVMRGDNYVLRSYSPLFTVGGGKIIEPVALKHKQKEKGLSESLNILKLGQDKELILYYLSKTKGPAALKEIAIYLGKGLNTAESVLRELEQLGQVEKVGGEKDEFFVHGQVLNQWEKKLAREITAYLKERPLEEGINKEAVRTSLWPELPVKDFNALLDFWIAKAVIQLRGGQYLALAGHQLQLDQATSRLISAIEEKYRQAGWQVPNWEQVWREVGLNEKKAPQILQYLLRANILVSLGEELYLLAETLADGKEKLRAWFQEQPTLTVAEVRDLLGTTRKIAVPFLEYLDKNKFTLRQGETRRLIEKGGSF